MNITRHFQHLGLAVATIGAVVAGLGGASVGHAASSDVDIIKLRTNSGSMVSSMTWEHVVYFGDPRDLGSHHMTSLRLSNAACADVTIDWFDGELPNQHIADSHMAYHICNSLGSDQTYAFDMSRLNEPPAERAIVCLATSPELNGLPYQQTCVTSLPFVDSPVTGI